MWGAPVNETFLKAAGRGVAYVGKIDPVIFGDFEPLHTYDVIITDVIP
ncbi:hypothetical protein AGMMS49992_33360 [Clostridia bacterium]|nr:hypothetical protein AGMMS49992_33360 [Clostridia bacterium]